MTLHLNPLIAAGVGVSTALTDAVYVMFTASVTQRRPARAATWSSLWYLLSAFAVISYTGNPLYVLFAAGGSWLGAFASVKWLARSDRIDPSLSAFASPHKPPAPLG
jgi:hypothetical protein